jgi:RNA-binding protein
MDSDVRKQIHEMDATLRVGKGGVASVADELASQLDDRNLVKVRFLRSALGDTDAEALAADLAEAAGAELVESRGNTGVYR